MSSGSDLNISINNSSNINNTSSIINEEGKVHIDNKTFSVTQRYEGMFKNAFLDPQEKYGTFNFSNAQGKNIRTVIENQSTTVINKIKNFFNPDRQKAVNEFSENLDKLQAKINNFLKGEAGKNITDIDIKNINEKYNDISSLCEKLFNNPKLPSELKKFKGVFEKRCNVFRGAYATFKDCRHDIEKRGLIEQNKQLKYDDSVNQKKINDLESNVRIKENDLNTTKQELKDATTDLKQTTEKMQKEVENYKSQLKTNESEISELKKKVDEQTRIISEQEGKISERNKEITKLHNLYSSKENENNENLKKITNEKNKLIEENKKLHQSNKILNAKNKKLIAKNKETQEISKLFQHESAKLAKGKDHLEDLLMEAHKVNQGIKAENQKLNETISILNDIAELDQEENRILDEKQNTLSKENQDLKQTVRDKNAEIQYQEDAIEGLKDSLSYLKQSINKDKAQNSTNKSLLNRFFK